MLPCGPIGSRLRCREDQINQLEINSGNRILQNLSASLMLSAPVLVAILLCLLRVNRGKPGI